MALQESFRLPAPDWDYGGAQARGLIRCEVLFRQPSDYLECIRQAKPTEFVFNIIHSLGSFALENPD